MKKKSRAPKQNIFFYRLAQAVCWFVAKFTFKRKFLRNEIKRKKGPFVIIANHEAAYDFVNLIGATATPMTFVVSQSFYNTLPVKSVMSRVGVIPKQQFQTTLTDIKRMKAVIDAGRVLVIYPAGLMCEDGVSTPIPPATYQFLKWIKADIYVARTKGTYFAMPKWAKGFRPGKTYMDIYKLFDKEELQTLSNEEIRARGERALLFDAYREQEELLVKYKHGDHIEGLQNVLYQCPHCKKEFSMCVKGKNTIYCEKCGFEEVSDKYAFLHNERGVGKEIRYVSDWSRMIYDELKAKIEKGLEERLSSVARFQMIDYEKHRFVDVGHGVITLSKTDFRLVGMVHNAEVDIKIPIHDFASLPFKPGKHLEIQSGDHIYRCVLEDGKLAMKYINMVKIFYELHLRETTARVRAEAE